MTRGPSYLHTPVSRSGVESLQVDDVVYLSGKLFTLRDLAHQRIERLLESGKTAEIPFDLEDRAIFHGSPVIQQSSNGVWTTVSLGATSSSRFSPRVRALLAAMGPRVFIGKGTLTQEAFEPMRAHGAVYLQAIGGCAALYASRVERVVNQYWPEFGMVDSVWEFEVTNFGPLTVSIDLKGNSSYRRLREVILKGNLPRIYQELGIDPGSDIVWWPCAVAGSRQATEYAVSWENVD